jgi:hypothetical protein
MQKILMTAAVLCPAPAMAYELWCMPAQICDGAEPTCSANSDTERSVRLTDPDGPQPMMRAYAEDVAMTQTMLDNDIIRWTGANQYGISMVLDLDPADMSYTMTARLSGQDERVYTGACEVQ